MRHKIKYKIGDRALLGLLAGFGGTLAKDLTEEVLVGLGLATSGGFEQATSILSTPEEMNSFWGKLNGRLGDWSIGASLGIPILYFLSLTGKKYSIIKGLSLGSLVWFYYFGVLRNLGGSAHSPLPSKTTFANFLSHLVYGATTTGLISLLGPPEIFDPQKIFTIIEKEQGRKGVSLRHQYHNHSLKKRGASK